MDMSSENMVAALEHKLLDVVMKLLRGDISQSPLCRLTKGRKSPIIIPFDEVENSFIVYYPPNSEHYVDQWDGKRKLCKILDGTIYEGNEKQVYEKNDTFEIEGGKKYDPHTLDEHCIAFVKKLD